ncbi:MAG: anaerobic ribonucleoside-triphosphate reductase [Paraclostridium sp.]
METYVYSQCRAYLSPWWNVYGEEVYNGRFNLGATSINLPKIAINAKGNLQDFYKELDEVLEICRENCMFRAKYMEDTPSDIAPILWQSGALAELEPGETIKELIWGGYATISIGYIGLSEVSRLMFGKDFAEDEKSYKETYAILSYIKGRIDHFKKEDNLGYALYATPSESLCDRFAKNDLAKYGSIEGITDKGYYENSFHVASNIEIDPFNKMRLEGKAHGISTGGHISYIETPSLIDNLQALDGLIRIAYDAGVHYFGVNQPIDHCFECGFKGEFLPTVEGYKCPSCGNQNSQTISVIRRVCGYLAQPDARPFNAGKQQEVINRTNHIKNENGSLKKTHA